MSGIANTCHWVCFKAASLILTEERKGADDEMGRELTRANCNRLDCLQHPGLIHIIIHKRLHMCNYLIKYDTFKSFISSTNMYVFRWIWTKRSEAKRASPIRKLRATWRQLVITRPYTDSLRNRLSRKAHRGLLEPLFQDSGDFLDRNPFFISNGWLVWRVCDDGNCFSLHACYKLLECEYYL